jgi:hypothetical protein
VVGNLEGREEGRSEWYVSQSYNMLSSIEILQIPYYTRLSTSHPRQLFTHSSSAAYLLLPFSPSPSPPLKQVPRSSPTSTMTSANTQPNTSSAPTAPSSASVVFGTSAPTLARNLLPIPLISLHPSSRPAPNSTTRPSHP